MVQDMKIRLWVWSRAGRSGRGCGPGLEDQGEGVVQGLKIRLRMWSGEDSQAEGVVQGWKIRLRVWSRV